MWMAIATRAIPAGVIGVLLWGTVFGMSVETALVIGAVIGIVLSILLSLYATAASASGTLHPSEALAATRLIFGPLAILIIGAGVLAWAIRLILF